MQRAAASTSTSPSTSQTQTPATEPLAKRRRIESTASSPPASAPGTPSQDINTPTEVTPSGTPSEEVRSTNLNLSRGGISSFNRGPGADTEWVLDLSMKFPGDARVVSKLTDHITGQISGIGGSRYRFDDHKGPDDEGVAEEDEEEDIWNNQPSGRYTYGSFKQKGKRKTTPKVQDGKDQDFTSMRGDSESDSDSANDSDGDADSSASADTKALRLKMASRGRMRSTTHQSKDPDSDEEMRQVRRAIEQKHRNMMGTGTRDGASGSGGRGGRNAISTGPKRRRALDDGGHKAKKKARKTL